jgi:hypothetical protein
MGRWEVRHYKKKVCFCNWPCNSIFELQRTFAIHYIYTLWMLIDKLQELQNCNSPYKWCNSLHLCQKYSFSITMQLHYNCTWCHVDIINCHPSLKNLNVALWKILDIKMIFFSKYWSPLSITIINDGLKL